MKKIAIVTRKMVAGGIEKSLISMLEVIPKDKYDITLYVMARGGEFEKDIPNNVKIKCLYGDEKSTIQKVISNLKNYNIIQAIKIILYTILYKKSKYVFDKEMCHSKMLGVEDDEYDLAIADHVPASFPVVYVVNNLKAKKRVAWIHSDVSLYKNELKRYKQYYDKYDKIFSVSQEAAEKLKDIYPDLSNKIDVFYNIISKEKLRNLAKQTNGFYDNYYGIRILTIGRLCEQKGQDLIPSIVKKLLLNGYDFRWYCIGDGEYRTLLENKIKEYNLIDNLILLGTKGNPYGYLSECDIYVQSSRHECYCTTVTEAKCFSKPMIITDVNGSNEQIINNKTGLIVGKNIDDIYMAIKKLIEDKSLREKFKNNLNSKEVDTKGEIKKLYSLMLN